MEHGRDIGFLEEFNKVQLELVGLSRISLTYNITSHANGLRLTAGKSYTATEIC
jgi:hypothetical protein